MTTPQLKPWEGSSFGFLLLSLHSTSQNISNFFLNISNFYAIVEEMEL